MKTEIANFIKRFVQAQLISVKLPDGNFMVGYGNTINVHSGTAWSQKQAEEDLLAQTERHYKLVLRTFEKKLGKNQIIALASLFMDVGLEEIRKTSLINYVNQGKHALVCNEFLKFNKVGRTVSMKKVQRRKAEIALYNSEI